MQRKLKVCYAILATAFLGAGAYALDEAAERAMWKSVLTIEQAVGSLAETQAAEIAFLTFDGSDKMAFDLKTGDADAKRFIVSESAIDECNSVHYLAAPEVVEAPPVEDPAKGGEVVDEGEGQTEQEPGTDEGEGEEETPVATVETLEVWDHSQRSCEDEVAKKVVVKYGISEGDRLVGEFQASGDVEMLDTIE